MLLSLFMVSMGLLHFGLVEPFARAVPDYLPHHRFLVLVSGFFEILGGVALQIPYFRRLGGYGLIALFAAVYPANVSMALHSSEWLTPGWRWILWARLPLQFVFIRWAFRAGQAGSTKPSAQAGKVKL